MRVVSHPVVLTRRRQPLRQLSCARVYWQRGQSLRVRLCVFAIRRLIADGASVFADGSCSEPPCCSRMVLDVVR